MTKEPTKYKTYPSDVNYSSKKAYRKFIKETKRSDITYEMFVKIPELVHEGIIDKIFTGPYSIRIPNFGLIRLLKLRPFEGNKSLIDWGRYRKTGVWAPFRNSHTNGYIYKLHLYSYVRKNPELGFLTFKPALKHQRHLAQLIKNNELRR